VSASDPAGAVFAALADPTRREVIRRLAERGPLTATELAASLGISRQAVAKHLATLAVAGLAAGTRDGRETRYTLRTEPFAHAEAWMRAIGASWDQRLGALKDLLERRSLRVVR
jgi:ArsR family transcriptional regulator, cadmium/lead-responsive transcriptional repressor